MLIILSPPLGACYGAAIPLGAGEWRGSQMRKMVLAALAATTVAGSAQATFLGDTIRGTFNYPDLSGVRNDGGTKVVAPTASITVISGAINPTITISANQIDIGFADSGTFGFGAFLGPLATDLTDNDIVGATLDSSSVLAGFDASRLLFGANYVGFNLQGLRIQSTDHLRANVTFASTAVVPEPASWAMMVGGLGLIGAAMRRRKVAVSVA